MQKEELPLRPGQLFERWWVRWLLILGIWSLYGILSLYQTYLARTALGYGVDWSRAIPYLFSTVWGWALITPAVLLLARRFRVDRDNWARRLPLHLAIGVTIAALDAYYDSLLAPWTREVAPHSLLADFLYQLDFNLFLYLVIVAIAHSVHYYGLYRERRLRAAQLEAQLAVSHVQLLKMQLQPHFLFNTLNAISELVHEDPAAAERMITRLGDLLRLTIDENGDQEVPLKRELEYLHAYLDIERTRFRDRLTVRYDIDPEALDARVPSLILQPLVENAIRHGLSPRAAPGRIDIVAVRRAGRLHVEVRDNGNGLPAGTRPRREGVGLRNTRIRLEQLYGSAHRFEVQNAESGGVVVRIIIPCNIGEAAPRPAAGAAEAVAS